MVVQHKSKSESFRTLLHSMRGVAKQFKTIQEVKEKRRPRVAYCGHARVDENSGVNIVQQKDGGISYNGVASCSNYWRCPVCAYKIVQQKQKFLYGLIAEHSAVGGKVGFVTLTLRHKRRDRLKFTLDKLLTNYRAFQQSRWFRDFKNELLGQVKSMEITWSGKNGWHPHLHILYMWNHEISQTKISAFQKELIKRWAKFRNNNKDPRKRNNSTITAQNQKICYRNEITDYISKWDISQEITKGNVKSSKGLTIHTALAKVALQDYVSTDEKCLLMGLYGEYIEATFGKNFLIISNSLRKEYREYFATEEKTDDEICNTSEISAILAKVSIPVWRELSKLDLQPIVLSAFQRGLTDTSNKEQLTESVNTVFSILHRYKAMEHLYITIDSHGIPNLVLIDPETSEILK